MGEGIPLKSSRDEQEAGYFTDPFHPVHPCMMILPVSSWTDKPEKDCLDPGIPAVVLVVAGF